MVSSIVQFARLECAAGRISVDQLEAVEECFYGFDARKTSRKNAASAGNDSPGSKLFDSTKSPTTIGRWVEGPLER
jgi:hypothetical protein